MNSGPYHRDAGQRAMEELGLQRLSGQNWMMMMIIEIEKGCARAFYLRPPSLVGTVEVTEEDGQECHFNLCM